jgi:hypothetical protein
MSRLVGSVPSSPITTVLLTTLPPPKLEGLLARAASAEERRALAWDAVILAYCLRHNPDVRRRDVFLYTWACLYQHIPQDLEVRAFFEAFMGPLWTWRGAVVGVVMGGDHAGVLAYEDVVQLPYSGAVDAPRRRWCVCLRRRGRGTTWWSWRAWPTSTEKRPSRRRRTTRTRWALKRGQQAPL